MAFPPERIVCLSEETVETLYLLGAEERIAGVSGYAVRPPQVRRQKPRVAAFTSANVPKILALEPDLVLAFSDLQADIVAELVRAGLNVHVFNQRDVTGIFGMVEMLGALVDRADRAAALVKAWRDRLARTASAQQGKVRPRIYFEKWDDPMISGIGWVSELIELAGGEDCFADRACGQAAGERIVTSDEVVAADPQIIVGSWCGKKFRAEKVSARPGWSRVSAVRGQALHEIKSPLILQPGPAALTDGFDALVSIVDSWRARQIVSDA